MANIELSQLTGFDQKDLPVLNELLRRLENKISETSDDLATTIPSGVILLWSGAVADIPTGWVLCDGNNSTPDLTNRFIVCADADDSGVAKTTLTGAATQSGNCNVEAHAHTHTVYTTMSAHTANRDGGAKQDGELSYWTETTDTYGTGTETYPRYYALAYIMKT